MTVRLRNDCTMALGWFGTPVVWYMYVHNTLERLSCKDWYIIGQNYIITPWCVPVYSDVILFSWPTDLGAGYTPSLAIVSSPAVCSPVQSVDCPFIAWTLRPQPFRREDTVATKTAWSLQCRYKHVHVLRFDRLYISPLKRWFQHLLRLICSLRTMKC